jgi:tRNA(Arg) A34 adenosine deaminase TadA
MRRRTRLFCRLLKLPILFGGIFKLATKLAETSTYGNFRHGAVLVKGGAIQSLGFNNEKYCSRGAKYRPEEKGHATYHAEIRAILGVPYHITRNSVIYVARVNKVGENRISKPCSMCQSVLAAQGIRKAIYSIDENNYGIMKIDTEV